MAKLPDEFLNDVSTTSTVDGTWSSILAAQGLTALAAEAQKLESDPADAGNANICIATTDAFWGVTADQASKSNLNCSFLSERNGPYFIGLPPGSDAHPNDRKNCAWIGDASGSAVALLQTQVTSGKLGLRDLCTALGADLKRHYLVSAFLDAIDATGALQATQVSAPDWKDPTDKTKGLNYALGTSTTTAQSTAPASALWFTTANDLYCVSCTLTYVVTLDPNVIVNWVTSCFDGTTPKISLPTQNVFVSITRKSFYDLSGRLTSTFVTVNFAIDVVNFNLRVDFTASSQQLTLTPTQGSSIRELISSALGKDFDRLPNSTGSDPVTSFFGNDIHLWYVKVLHQNVVLGSGSGVSWAIGLLCLWKPNGQSVLVALTYDSLTSTFAGRLLLAQDVPDYADVRGPNWDQRLSPFSISSLNAQALGDSLNIWTLLGFDASKQPPIPTALKAAKTSLSTPSAGTVVFSFSADLIRPPTVALTSAAPNAADSAPMPFVWNDVVIDVNITKANGKTAYDIAVFTDFDLTPPAGSNIPAGSIAVGLECMSTGGTPTWLLRASAQNISVGLLHSFFEPEITQNGALGVMDRINMNSLNLLYTYSSGSPSSFLLTAVLSLGKLSLDLAFQYVSPLVAKDDQTAAQQYNAANAGSDGGISSQTNVIQGGQTESQWSFEAVLQVNSAGSTVSEIVESVVPGSSSDLPNFVGDIVVDPAVISLDDPACMLKFAKTGKSSYLLMIYIKIAGFSMTFMQYKAPTVATAEPVQGALKRIVRISVDQIPLLDKIPIAGQMPQAFDHLEYIWVQVNPPDKDPTSSGITRQDLADISTFWTDSTGWIAAVPTLQVKETKSNAPTDILLATGHHFLVVVSGKVVLDHVFQTNAADSKPVSKDDPKPVDLQLKATGPDEPPAAIPEAQPTKGDTKTTAGPFSVSAISLQYQHGSLMVSLDATLKLGPLTFSVISFTIELELNKVKLDDLAGIITNGLVHVALHGLEVGVQQGPLTLKGVFIHDNTPAGESYRGGVAIGFKAWQVLAVGEYFIKKAPDGSELYKAVFVYGKLDGPLIELEFATISGVRIGFGYNYAVRMPELNELYDFPFINDTGAAGNVDPLDVLNKMVGAAAPPAFVYPKLGSSWFCAGMTITAFDVLTLTAVLIADIDSGASSPADAGIVIAILADGVLQMEPLVSADLSLFYIELVVKIELNFVHGYIAAEAALAPRSHVYVPAAQLQGSAAFYSWFGQNPHAGDWVVSVGGYTRSYAPPAWYPAPDRISLNFTVGDMIHVVGDGYMAVTPKCAMAGGSLHMTLSVGPVSAFVDIVLDAYINFKPFHFHAEMSISVGVECDIDILFVHIHVSVHVGADLVLWGPHDFGGIAHVDFWFFGFDIGFGADENPAIRSAITLQEFYDMVKAPGPTSSAPPTDTIGSAGAVATAHKYSVETGLAPVAPPTTPGQNFPSTGATTTWDVLAGTLAIRIDTDFALSEAHILKSDSKKQEIYVSGTTNGAAPSLFSKPMHNTSDMSLTSTIEIQLYWEAAGQQFVQDDFKAELVLKSAAPALWGVYDPSNDPLQQSNLQDLQNGQVNMLQLAQAVRILPPDPKLDVSKIIDFDATAAMRETIKPDNGTDCYSLPVSESQGTTFTATYFDPPPAPNGPVVPATKRWPDFQAAWVTYPASPPTSPAVDPEPNISTEMVKTIADLLEWTIRPAGQMSRNDATVAPTSGVKWPNQARMCADGRYDWELRTDAPTRLVKDLDVNFAALPYVTEVS